MSVFSLPPPLAVDFFVPPFFCRFAASVVLFDF